MNNINLNERVTIREQPNQEQINDRIVISEDTPPEILLDLNCVILSCNKKFAQLLGFQIQEIIDNKEIREFIHHDDLPAFNAVWMSLIKSEVSSVQEILRIKKQNDSFVKTKINLSKIFFDNKLTLTGTVMEVFESRTTDPTINILSQVVNTLNEGIILADLNQLIFYVNESLCSLVGYSAEELLGKNVNSLFEDCMSELEYKEIFSNPKENIEQHELTIRKKDDSSMRISLRKTRLADKNNNPIATLFLLDYLTGEEKVMRKPKGKKHSYYNLFEKMHDAFAYVKIVTNIENELSDVILLEANIEFGKFIQEPIESNIGQSILSKLKSLKGIDPSLIELIAKVTSLHREERYEVKVKNSNRWYSVSVYSPEKTYAFIIIHDISKEKIAEQETNKSKQMLRLIVDNIPQRVFWKDKDSRFLGCNVQFAQDIGLSDPSEIEGKNEYDFASLELAEQYIKTDKYILKTGKPIHASEYDQHIKSGPGKIKVSLNKLPLRNENNEIIGIIGTYEDISKQSAVEEKLRKLSQAVEQSPISIVITDTSGNIEYVNKKFSTVTGYSFQEVYGKNPKILKSGEMSSDAYRELWHTISSGKEWEGEFHNKKKNGELYWEKATISPIKGSNGVVTHYMAIKEDITEQRKSEKDLRDNERLLRDTQAITRLGSYILDIPKGVWSSSVILDDIFGIDENYNRSVESWVSLVHQEWREQMLDYFVNEVLKQHKRFDKEYKIVRKIDGEVRWVHGLGELEFDSENQPIKMIGTIRDVTDRKVAEEALRDSLSLLEGTLESTVDGILVVDENSKILKFNNKFLEMWKIPDSIIQSRDDNTTLSFVIDQLKYPEQFLEKVRALYKDRMAESFDLLEFTDGRVFERYSRPQLIGNKAVGRVWSFRDITGRKIAHEALAESEKKFRTLFETSYEGILASDINGKNVLVNPRMAEMTGYTVDELMKMNYEQLVPSDEMTKHLLKMEERKKGLSDVYERKLLRKGGSTIWVLVSASPLFDKEGKYNGSFGMFTDITNQKIIEKELVVAKDKAEETNRLKSIFLANISHELRTPLIGILGYAETLFNEIESPEFKEMARTLLKSGNRLKETLNLILDLTHIEANKLDVNISRINITTIIREKFKQYHSEANEKGLKFLLILEEDDLEINADERMLSQVIEHLLTNAIKYTNNGSITVTISKLIENKNHFVLLKIKDTGIGISKECAKLIFEPFRQASEGFSRLFEGLGIGLTITKRFIELMGGEISVESEIGEGSEFTVRFPQYVFDNSDSPKEYNWEKSSDQQISNPDKILPEVLLIEDDEPTANIVKFYLNDICKADWASNAKTAISMAEMKHYSALLVDINLGIGMDGIEAISMIKKIKEYEKVPIIAVTAYALYGDREKFLKQGCTHYISKPFGKDDIVALVNGVLHVSHEMSRLE